MVNVVDQKKTMHKYNGLHVRVYWCTVCVCEFVRLRASVFTNHAWRVSVYIYIYFLFTA